MKDVCMICSGPLARDDRFCGNCGAPVAAPAMPTAGKASLNLGIDADGGSAAIVNQGLVTPVPPTVHATAHQAVKPEAALTAWSLSAARLCAEATDGVVAAVPVRFTRMQRLELARAASAAGLHLVRTVSHPAAAFLGWLHGCQRPWPYGLFLVIHRSGERVDMALIEYCDSGLAEVRRLASVHVGLDGLSAESRSRVGRALADPDIAWARPFREVLASGASERLAELEAVAAAALGRPPVRIPEPERAAAKGAAVLGGILSGHVESLLLLDVVPFDLAILTHDGEPKVLVRAQAPKPGMGTTTLPAPPGFSWHIDLLEIDDAGGHWHAGRFAVESPRQATRLAAQLSVDANGEPTLQVSDAETGRPCSVAELWSESQ